MVEAVKQIEDDEAKRAKKDKKKSKLPVLAEVEALVGGEIKNVVEAGESSPEKKKKKEKKDKEGGEKKKKRKSEAAVSAIPSIVLRALEALTADPSASISCRARSPPRRRRSPRRARTKPSVFLPLFLASHPPFYIRTFSLLSLVSSPFSLHCLLLGGSFCRDVHHLEPVRLLPLETKRESARECSVPTGGGWRAAREGCLRP